MRLPEADAATKAWFLAWLETFSAHVRAVDYASARPLFHPDILAFGTHRDVLPSLEAWVNTQWDNVWPKTDDFRFDRGRPCAGLRRQKHGRRHRDVDEHRLRPGWSSVRSSDAPHRQIGRPRHPQAG